MFESTSTGGQIDWPSPISDESDPVDVLATTQPTGGFFTPDILPPVAETASAASSSTAVYWAPVETTTSSILAPVASEVSWRWKQKLRSQHRGGRPMTPSDDEGNVFSLLQTESMIKTDEFSPAHLAEEQQDLVTKLTQMDQTKPGWL